MLYGIAWAVNYKNSIGRGCLLGGWSTICYRTTVRATLVPLVLHYILINGPIQVRTFLHSPHKKYAADDEFPPKAHHKFPYYSNISMGCTKPGRQTTIPNGTVSDIRIASRAMSAYDWARNISVVTIQGLYPGCGVAQKVRTGMHCRAFVRGNAIIQAMVMIISPMDMILNRRSF